MGFRRSPWFCGIPTGYDKEGLSQPQRPWKWKLEECSAHRGYDLLFVKQNLLATVTPRRS